ncbi:GH25 family lysozyme [Lactobacillus delbrueckii]|uniref:GH25 family lysozyme n=1 Tax=Lactobacillus delbrueckii TaxID=1584 RepID=UPI0025B03A19|nr:GH25 family lysozyme [Lactobacillus delbrueckii]
MVSKTYGVDVAVYQPTDLSSYYKAGASFSVVKLTQGTGYFNPKDTAQIKSSRALGMETHAYHYAEFGSSVSRAKAEAKFFLQRAAKQNISKKRYLFLDWEAGSGNVVTGAKAANTAAIIAFMDACKKAGYKVGLYSGAALMRSAIDTAQIVKRYGTCLWVASYPTMSAVSSADFGYFPSMDGVLIWQFTSNWHGLGVDGNVAFFEAEKSAAKKETAKKATAKDFDHVVKVKDLGPGKASWKVRLLSKSGHYTDSYVPQGSSWKTAKVMTIKGMQCYLIGKNLWIPAKYVTVTK